MKSGSNYYVLKILGLNMAFIALFSYPVNAAVFKTLKNIVLAPVRIVKSATEAMAWEMAQCMVLRRLYGSRLRPDPDYNPGKNGG